MELMLQKELIAKNENELKIILKDKLIEYCKKHFYQAGSKGFLCPICNNIVKYKKDNTARCDECGNGGDIFAWYELKNKEYLTDCVATLEGMHLTIVENKPNEKIYFERILKRLAREMEVKLGYIDEGKLNYLEAERKKIIDKIETKKRSEDNIMDFKTKLTKSCLWEHKNPYTVEKWREWGISAQMVKKLYLGYNETNDSFTIPFFEFGSDLICNRAQLFRKNSEEREILRERDFLVNEDKELPEELPYRAETVFYKARKRSEKGKKTFILFTEEEIDAISVLQGIEAIQNDDSEIVIDCVALLSYYQIGKIKPFVESLSTDEHKKNICFMVISDEGPWSNGEEFKTELNKLFEIYRLKFVNERFPIYGIDIDDSAPDSLPKDLDGEVIIRNINDLLRTNKMVLNNFLKQALNKAHAKLFAEKNDFNDSFNTNITDSLNYIDYKHTPISTGFANINNAMGGGFINGLYILGAETSLGKTTLMLDIAEFIAEKGRDVLYVSTEQNRYELLSKSLSRLTYELTIEHNLASYMASSFINILHYPETIKDEQAELLESAEVLYKSIGEHFHVMFSFDDLTVDAIKEEAEKYKLYRGKTPVIFVDYLQNLAHPNNMYTEKQVIGEFQSLMHIV